MIITIRGRLKPTTYTLVGSPMSNSTYDGAQLDSVSGQARVELSDAEVIAAMRSRLPVGQLAREQFYWEHLA